MKMLIGLLVLSTSVATFANDKEAYAKMAKMCFEEVSIQVSIGISQARHAAEDGSIEARQAERDQVEFDLLMDTVEMTEKICDSVGEQRLDCQILTREKAIEIIVANFNAQDIKDQTQACDLID